MSRIPARERLVSLAGSFFLAIIVIRQEAHRWADRNRPNATVTDINTRRTPGEE